MRRVNCCCPNNHRLYTVSLPDIPEEHVLKNARLAIAEVLQKNEIEPRCHDCGASAKVWWIAVELTESQLTRDVEELEMVV